ncbi:MAG TPA: hypothetical protein VG474_17430, partial [Solirubrobacteraceae bacterium]|nr:hypothetical protein [Solirubrobacteraceae bacterium]
SLAGLLAERIAVQEESLAEPLDKADKELLKAIEALVQEDPKAYEHLVEALDHVADAADVLVDGVIFTQVEDPQPEREP